MEELGEDAAGHRRQQYGGGRGTSQTGNRLKSHGSRGNFADSRDYGNRDHGNRRGGSFVGAGGASFRGRGQPGKPGTHIPAFRVVCDSIPAVRTLIIAFMFNT